VSPLGLPAGLIPQTAGQSILSLVGLGFFSPLVRGSHAPGRIDYKRAFYAGGLNCPWGVLRSFPSGNGPSVVPGPCRPSAAFCWRPAVTLEILESALSFRVPAFRRRGGTLGPNPFYRLPAARP